MFDNNGVVPRDTGGGEGSEAGRQGIAVRGCGLKPLTNAISYRN